jgi:Family of unknown function (DUF6088)
MQTMRDQMVTRIGRVDAGAGQDRLSDRWPEQRSDVGRRSIHFKHARPKARAGLEGKYALVVQALRHLGRESVGAAEIATLREALSPAEKCKLVKDTRFGVDWIYEVAKRIAV